MTHTFSCLGSFAQKHNPEHWWIFSAAIVFWGASGIPLVLHIYRNFRSINENKARIGAAFFLAGYFGIALVGVFPYGPKSADVFGIIRLNTLHDRAAAAAAVSFILAVVWHGLMLVRVRGSSRRDRKKALPGQKSLIPPFALFFSVLSASVYFRVKWRFVYANLSAAAEAEGKHIASAWREALDTRYSFPLWQHICIITLFIFMAWFSSALRSGEETG